MNCAWQHCLIKFIYQLDHKKSSGIDIDAFSVLDKTEFCSCKAKKKRRVPLDQEGRSSLYVRPSTPRASRCSRSRCNTDKPAGSASPSSRAPTDLPECLPRRIKKERWQKLGQAGWEQREMLFSKKSKYRLKRGSLPGSEASRNTTGATYHTGGQNPQGGRKSAEQRGPPSNCLTHSFARCPSSSASPPTIWAAFETDTFD